MSVSLKNVKRNNANLRKSGKIIVFTCNWSAYYGLETACKEHHKLPPFVYPLRINCLGQLNPGILLKTLEKGAQGILLLGCPPGECHYHFGNHRVQEVVSETHQLIHLLGYAERQIKLDWIPLGGKDVCITRIFEFINELSLGEKP